MEKVRIDNQDFEGVEIPTPTANILMIKGQKGFLGCGYFDIETANKLNEPVAIVTGVKTYDDMLEAKVIKVSQSAQELGVKLDLTGKEALLLLN